MATAAGDLAERIKACALEAGYDACGIAEARPFDDFGAELDDRERRFPEAAALYEGLRSRVDPLRHAAWVRAVAVCVRWYGKYRMPEPLLGRIGRSYLADRRFPECPDHGLPRRFKESLRALGLRVRTGGLPDRAAARRAGVARIARNGFACSRRGSWINVETFRIDAEVPPDAPAEGCPCPPGCRACVDACPTGALQAPYRMRWDHCVAHLTYGPASECDPSLRRAMGGWIYGCDACQQVCPLNAGRWEEREPAPWIESVRDRLTPEALAAMDDRVYREIVQPRFWYLGPDQAERWRENARRALQAGPAVP